MIYVKFGVLLVLMGMSLSSGSHYHHEAQLHREILSSEYNKEIRPADESDNPVKVKVYPTLVRIENIDEDRQLMETTLSLSMSWTDQRLKWHPIDYGSITQTHVTLEKLWKPDIGLSNGLPASRDDVTRSVMAVVSSSGTVAAVLLLRSRSYCVMDLTKFPFDSQTCILQMGSWIYSYRQLIMEFWSDNKYTLSMPLPIDQQNSRPWTLHEGSLTATIHNVTHDCCPDDPFVQLQIPINIDRKSNYISHVLVTQLFIFAWLLPLIFVLPAKSRDRTVFGVLVLVGDLLNIHAMAQCTPSKAASPTIGTLYIINLCACFVALLASHIVTWIARHHHTQPMPRSAQMILLRLRKLCCHNKSDDNVHVNSRKLIAQEEQELYTTEINTELERFQEIHEQTIPATEHLQSTVGEKVGHESSKDPKLATSVSIPQVELIKLAKSIVETNHLLRIFRDRMKEYKDRQCQGDMWSELAAHLDKLFATLFSLVDIVTLIILCVVAT